MFGTALEWNRVRLSLGVKSSKSNNDVGYMGSNVRREGYLIIMSNQSFKHISFKQG
jgi:hypothetical protein